MNYSYSTNYKDSRPGTNKSRAVSSTVLQPPELADMKFRTCYATGGEIFAQRVRWLTMTSLELSF